MPQHIDQDHTRENHVAIQGWDSHRDLPNQLAGQCGDTVQATAALLLDLTQRGS